MPSSVEELADNRVKLTIEIPFSDLKPSMDKAYREIAQQIQVPGFRKGKVPAAVIDQRVGRGTVIQEAINAVLPQAFGAALEEHDITPLGQPEIELTKMEDGKLVEFTAEVDKTPDFELPDVSQIKVEVDPLRDDEGELDERLGVLRERFATVTDVDRAAAEGDVVVADLAGTRNGEPLEDATAEGVSFKIGAGAMLAGLDEAVTGKKAGETATFTSTLVGGPHKGEDADIAVTVVKVQEQELPEVDDEFAQMVSQFDTVEAMTDDLRSGIEQQAKITQANQARDKVLESVVDEIGLELPARTVAEDQEARHKSVEEQLSQAGYSLEDYLAEVEDGKSVEDFWADLDRRGLIALKARLILDKFAGQHDISVEQNDLTQYLVQRAVESGTSPEQELQHMMEHDHAGEWMQEIRRNKALAVMVSEATIVDTDGNEVDLAALTPPEPATVPVEDAVAAEADIPPEVDGVDEADVDTEGADEA